MRDLYEADCAGCGVLLYLEEEREEGKEYRCSRCDTEHELAVTKAALAAVEVRAAKAEADADADADALSSQLAKDRYAAKEVCGVKDKALREARSAICSFAALTGASPAGLADVSYIDAALVVTPFAVRGETVGGANYHVFALGADTCTICGWNRRANEPMTCSCKREDDHA